MTRWRIKSDIKLWDEDKVRNDTDSWTIGNGRGRGLGKGRKGRSGSG